MEYPWGGYWRRRADVATLIRRNFRDGRSPTMDIDLCSMGSSGDRVLGLVRGGLEGRGGFRWNLINWYCARFPKFISAKYLRVFRRCTESRSWWIVISRQFGRRELSAPNFNLDELDFISQGFKLGFNFNFDSFDGIIYSLLNESIFFYANYLVIHWKESYFGLSY